METENLLDRIQQLFGRIPANLSILQEQIDIELQAEYFEQSKKSREVANSKETGIQRELLFNIKTSRDGKKEALVNLASIDDVEAYRAIEKFVSLPDSGLKEWATMALHESRMLLECKLLDENQLLISTGLGGKGSKLRYFLVLISKGEHPLNENHHKIVRGEFEYWLSRNDSEIESIQFYRSFISMLVIIPLQIPVKNLFKKAIQECNLFGDFIQDTFILTNIKQLSEEEIVELLDSNGNKED
jgi:hypothetical protein